jgi:hypothetical protein
VPPSFGQGTGKKSLEQQLEQLMFKFPDVVSARMAELFYSSDRPMKPRRGIVGLTGSPTSAYNASFNKGFAATTRDA